MILRVIWQYIDRLIAPKSYMDRSAAEVHITFWGNQPVHILPFDPKYHELFVILCFSQVFFQGINCGWSNLVVHVHVMLSIFSFFTVNMHIDEKMSLDELNSLSLIMYMDGVLDKYLPMLLLIDSNEVRLYISPWVFLTSA